MPIAVLLLLLAPLPVAVVGMQQEYTREQKVIELCTQKFVYRQFVILRKKRN